MKLRPRKAAWLVSGLLLLTVASAGLPSIGGQPTSKAENPPLNSGEDAFELLGEHKLVNLNTVMYTSDNATTFDIYFTCSSSRGEDPLRLTDAKDIRKARSYFNDEKRYGTRFVKLSNHWINIRNIAYVEFIGDSIVVNFNARVSDAFVRLPLAGADAESFSKKIRQL